MIFHLWIVWTQCFSSRKDTGPMTGEPTIEISHLVVHRADVLSGQGWDSTAVGKSTQLLDSLHCHHHHGESSSRRVPGRRKGKGCSSRQHCGTLSLSDTLSPCVQIQHFFFRAEGTGPVLLFLLTHVQKLRINNEFWLYSFA